MIKKLKVYKGAEHPHKAQKLEKIQLVNIWGDKNGIYWVFSHR
jgi:ribosomal protein L13